MRRYWQGSPTRARVRVSARRLVAFAALVVPALLLVSSTASAEVPGRGVLPHNRAWEMVSPPDKNGNDVLVDPSRTPVAASDGNLPMAAMFSSFGGFSDVRGIHSATDYVSQRTLLPGTPGWSTHGVIPPQNSGTVVDSFFSNEALYLDVTPDLSAAVFRAYSPLPVGQSEGVLGDIYSRTDLRSAGLGSYRFLNPCAIECTPTGPPTYAQMSPDGKRLLFATGDQLTDDAPEYGDAKPYEAIDGAVRFVGYLPQPSQASCTGVAPACLAPTETGFGTVNGSRVLPNAISADGSRIFLRHGSGRLYVRDDRGTAGAGDDVTTQINFSERSVPAAAESAEFWATNPTGTRAFFTTTEPLTDDAPHEGRKLYRWSSVPNGEGRRLINLSVDDEATDPHRPVLGVLGASDDGAVVYFLQEGQIVSGEEPLGTRVGIYRWRQGDGVSYLGEVVDTADRDVALSSFNPPQSRVAPDGAHLLLALHQPPTPGGPDHGSCPDGGGTVIDGEAGCREMYLYEAETDTLVCASCDPEGAPPGSPAEFAVRSLGVPAGRGTSLNRPLSDDGRYVFFSTAEALVEGDGNGTIDAYVYDAEAGVPFLLSSGDSGSASYFLDASADGHDAFIVTRERLSDWDVDGNRDLYDARVNGGVPEPPSQPSECAGDACQPPAQGLDDPAPATARTGGRRAKRKPVCAAQAKAAKHAARKGRCSRWSRRADRQRRRG